MSTIAVVKASAGYQPANQRQACKNCAQGEEVRTDRMPPYDTATWQCKRFGFKTTAMAICHQHQPRPTTRSTP